MVFFESELLAERKIIGRIQERFEFEAAEDSREHFRFSNSGGEIKFRHRVSGAEKMVGGFGGVAFGGGENKIGQRALKVSERRAVDVMNNDGHSGAFRGEPSENSRLAAVRVDEAGFLFTQNFFQFSERDEIFERMNGADKFGDDGEQAGNFCGFSFERTFRPNRRAGDQIDFDAEFLAQTVDGGEGVFLCATDDEPGDDVRDAHGVIWREAASGVRGRSWLRRSWWARWRGRVDNSESPRSCRVCATQFPRGRRRLETSW